MKNVILKDGRTLIIRKAEKSDAKKMVEYISHIGGESDNLTFGANEFELTVEKEELIIDTTNIRDNAIMMVGEIDGDIVSLINLNCGTRPRTRHVGEFGISVRKAYWGLGIGNAMLTSLIAWARATSIIKKINLKVRADNTSGIALYKKNGFKEEGISTRDMYINNKFYDCLLMGLELE